MKTKCERCGTWAYSEYILVMGGEELCVLCALQAQEDNTELEAER